MNKPPRPPLAPFAQRVGFVLALGLRIAGRGLALLWPQAKATAPPADYDDIIEALQSPDTARLAAFGAGFASGCDPYGQPWLYHAIDIGSLPAFEWFLRHKAPLNADKSGRSPLQAAIERSLAVDEFDDAPEDPQGWLAALLRSGADPNAADARGLRPLHIAASLHAADATRTLIAHGANPALTDALGLTPADYAA